MPEPVIPLPAPTPIKPTPPLVAKPPEVKQSDAGLSQPLSQNPVKPVVDDNPVPVSIRGHKAVPAHPEARLSINPQYKGNADGNPKTMQQCVDEFNAKTGKKPAEPAKPATPTPTK